MGTVDPIYNDGFLIGSRKLLGPLNLPVGHTQIDPHTFHPIDQS